MFIVHVFVHVKPEYVDQWIDLTREFTEATRAEPGNLFFDWSRSIYNPDEFVLIEAFKEDAAEAHVTSEHFKRAQATFPAAHKLERREARQAGRPQGLQPGALSRP